MNDVNKEFYDNITVDILKELAIIGGFDSCPDLKIIYPSISGSKSIIELGAGYGRSIDYLLCENHFSGKITAVERSETFVEYIKTTYSDFSDRLTVLKTDIKKLSTIEDINGFDAALWLWSGMVDFSLEEQKRTVKGIYSVLNKGGMLFIDNPSYEFMHKRSIEDFTNKIGTLIDEHIITFDTDFGLLKGYLPNENQVISMAISAGFINSFSIGYQTKTAKERTLYIMTK
jgi:SAM-dependent methyltransferase